MTPRLAVDPAAATPPDADLRERGDLSLARLLRTILRRRHLVLGATLAGALAAVAIGLALPKRYVGETLVQLVFQNAGTPTSSGSGGGGAIVLDAAALVKGETEIIASRTVARRVLASSPVAAEFAASRSSPGVDPVLALQKPLEVANDGKSYMVRIRFEAGSAQSAAEIANAFADAYQATRAEQEAGERDERATLLTSQIGQAERDADEAGDALQRFAEQTAVSIPASGTISPTDQELRDLLGQLSVRQAARREKALRVERLQGAAEHGAVPMTGDLEGSGEAQRLVEVEATARRDLALLRTSLGPLHPRYQKAQAALRTLEGDRADAVRAALALARTDLLSTETGERALLRDVARMQRMAVGEGPNLQRALQFQARWQSAVAGLDQLRTQLQQVRASGRAGPIGTVLVSPADALDRPVSLRLLTSLALGLIGGALAGLGLVYVSETRDTGYAEVGEAERELAIPCIGVLPGSAHPAQADARALREVALRSLVNRTGLSDPAPGRRFVVLGAALPGEVETGLVRELAELLTAAGRRVVLVEPSVSAPDALPLVAEAGTAGGESMVATAIACPAHDGDPVPEGERIRRAVPSFEEPEQLLSWLDANAGPCDVVLVQAPAVLTDARAAILARAADLFVLTLAWHRTSRAALALAVGQLAALPRPAAPLAFVFTQVDPKRHAAYGPRDALYFQNRYLLGRFRQGAAIAGGGV